MHLLFASIVVCLHLHIASKDTNSPLITKTMKQTILVTGASSGFGLLIATKLHDSGYSIIGTSRYPAKYAAKFPFKMIALDLDDEQSLATFSARLFREINQLDMLINNAGFLVSGIAEEIPVELGRQQFETNFWGTIKVTNAVLPHFRKQKSGKIITVGSIVGLVSFPNAAYYAASKHALEGYFKALRYELTEFNISVAMIQPSAFKTSIMDNSFSPLNKIDDYNSLRSKIEKFTTGLVNSAEDPAIVAEKVLNVVRADRPKFRNVVGKGTNVLFNLQHFAYGILEKNVLKQLNKN